MDPKPWADRLQATPDPLAALLFAPGSPPADWRPEPQRWSLVEIVHHLLDEECEDFPVRLRLTLEDPRQPWPSIDPESWVQERDYRAADLQTVLSRFRAERQASCQWLRSLPEFSGEKAHIHPSLGPIRAGDLLVSWVVHDHLHLRQVLDVQKAWWKKEGQALGFGAGYAGE